MMTRPLLPLGLALIGAAGCQSYFPNYGPSGMYSAFPPPNSYPASPAMPPRNPTYDPGRGSSPGGQTSTGPMSTGQAPTGPMKSETPLKKTDASTAGQKDVPLYNDPTSVKSPDKPARGEIPNDLGASDDESEILKPASRPSRSGPQRLQGVPDDPGDDLSRLDETDFERPREIERASAEEEILETPRVSRRSTRGLFKRGAEYEFLRGVAVRDPKGKGWRLKYSDDPTDGDQYGGTLALVGGRNLDQLQDDDTIHVAGEIDPSIPDRYGKPSYRVSELNWVKRRGE